jgi:DnaJ-class molecular chaperone
MTTANNPLRVFSLASYNLADHHVMSDDETIFISPKEAVEVLLNNGKVCEGSIVEFRLSSDNPTSCEAYADNGVWLANMELTKHGWGIDTSEEDYCPECEGYGVAIPEGCPNCGLVDWDNLPE